MKIETLEVAGFRSAVRAVRLPHNKPALNEGHYKVNNAIDEGEINYSASVGFDEKDINLMKTLAKRGDEHAKVLRGIIVWAEITAPIYFWSEMETYRIGHERLSSESTMHGIAKGLTGEELVRVKSELPMGTELKKVDYFSYQTLRRIVSQRNTHRLPQWHMFIDWVRTLPMAEQLIFDGTNVAFKEEDENVCIENK